MDRRHRWNGFQRLWFAAHFHQPLLMESPMQIRPAHLNDMAALLELVNMLFDAEHELVFDAEKSRRGFELMLAPSDDRLVLVAEVDGVVQGLCTGQMLISTAMGTPSLWVEDVIVRPEMRGRGIMPQLLGALEKWAIEKGASRVQLLCDMENELGLGFYPKMGYAKMQMVGFQKVF
ncbi:GNAT family N-acetyltransferase [bacterium]|nr:MAG: GNAT family N-acetyltransferase [bacterium]